MFPSIYNAYLFIFLLFLNIPFNFLSVKFFVFSSYPFAFPWQCGNTTVSTRHHAPCGVLPLERQTDDGGAALMPKYTATELLLTNRRLDEKSRFHGISTFPQNFSCTYKLLLFNSLLSTPDFTVFHFSRRIFLITLGYLHRIEVGSSVELSEVHAVSI